MSVPPFLTLRDPKGVLISTSFSLPAESLLERTVQPESESTVRNPAARIRYFDFIRTPSRVPANRISESESIASPSQRTRRTGHPSHALRRSSEAAIHPGGNSGLLYSRSAFSETRNGDREPSLEGDFPEQGANHGGFHHGHVGIGAHIIFKPRIVRCNIRRTESQQHCFRRRHVQDHLQ